MKRHLIVAVAIGLAWTFSGYGAVPLAYAATFTVNSKTDTIDATTATVDANPGDGICATPPLSGEGVRCTLRAAIMEANAWPGPDMINLPAGRYLASIHANPEDESRSGDFDIRSELTIVGAGRETTIIDGQTNPYPMSSERVLDVRPEANLTISDVTIQGGFRSATQPDGCGAGIRNGGTVTLQRSIVRDNLVFQGCRGGGIENTGTMSIIDSLVTHNMAQAVTAYGGGVFNTGSLTIVNSTISDNAAVGIFTWEPSAGGGIFNAGGSVSIANSTMTGNTAKNSNLHSDVPGSNIYASGGQLSLTNSTIFSNSPVGGSGISVGGSAAVSLKNTIVANGGTGANCSGSITSQGYNLENGTSCGLSQPTDRPHANPKLGPLADNGGPTETHALLAGSPAIDDGTNTGCAPTDQRGLPRPRDGDSSGTATCDIGAVELQEPYPVDLAVQAVYSPDPPDVGAVLTYRITVHAVDGSLAPSVVLTATVPAGATFGSATASQGSCQGTGPVTCTLGNIPAGTDAVVTILLTPTTGGALSAGAQVNSSLPDPNPANNTTSVSTQVHAVCAPRPNTALQATRVGPGTLQGTVTATRTALQPNNILQALQVTRLDNATITVNGVAATAGQTIALPPSTTQVRVVVTRVAPGAFTAHLSATDECGAWPTFLGGGAGVP